MRIGRPKHTSHSGSTRELILSVVGTELGLSGMLKGPCRVTIWLHTRRRCLNA